MVEITMLKLQLQDGSITTNLPFSGVADATDGDEAKTDGVEEDADSDESGSSGKKKLLTLLGVLAFLVVVAAVVKSVTGGDDPEVEIETADEPVDVTIDDE